MENELNPAQIDFAAIIFWDFVDESDEDELLTTLSQMYGEDVDEFGGPTMGGGSWYHRVAGNQTNEIEATEQFTSIRTLIQSDINGILDVTTFAILSEEQIKTVVNSDHRSGLEQLQSTLSDYLEKLPTLIDHEGTGHCGIYYAEWGGEQNLIPETEDFEIDDIFDRLEDAHPTLSSFGFQTGGNLSIIDGSAFVSPTVTMNLYKGLGVIRERPHPEAEPLDKLVLPPSWYQEISGLQRYYRLYTWANSRWDRLHEFDERGNDERNALSSLSTTETDVQEVLSVSQQIQALESEFTEFQTRYAAEYQSLKQEFSERADEVTNIAGQPYDIPLSRPNEPEFVERADDKSNSVIEYFEDNSEQTFEQVEELYTRITEKINSLTSTIESRTRLAATHENLILQNRVEGLTTALTWMTAVLVALTLVLVGIEIEVVEFIRTFV